MMSSRKPAVSTGLPLNQKTSIAFDIGSVMHDAMLDHKKYDDQPGVFPDSAYNYDFKVLLIIAMVTVPFLILAGIVVVFS